MVSGLRYFNELRTWSVVDTSDVSSAAWTTYTPVVSSVVGTITSYTASGRFQQIGKIVFVAIDVTITNNGTGSSGINMTLPITASVTVAQSLSGSENNTTGKTIHGTITTGGGSGIVFVRQYDNAYPANTGSELIISGTYEAA